MSFIKDLINKYGEINYFVNGGCSIIYNIKNNDNVVIKIMFYPSIYYNNIKFYKTLQSKIQTTKLIDNFITKENYNEFYKDENLKKFIDNKESFIKNIYKVDSLNNLELKLYCIIIKKYYTNSYYLFYRIFFTKEYEKREKELIILFTYYIYNNLLNILNLYNLNISHNDYKMDNILVDLNEQKDLINYFYDKKYSLINNFKYVFYLNDFDKTENKMDEKTDLECFKESVFSFFEEKKKIIQKSIDIKNFDYILEKLKKTNSINDIELLWLEKSSSYKILNIFKYIIKDYIKDYIYDKN